MSHNRIWILMSRKFSGAAAPEELKELEALLRRHPEALYSFEILKTIWPVPPENQESVTEDEEPFDEISGPPAEDGGREKAGGRNIRRIRPVYRWAACAAGLALLLGSAFYFGWFDRRPAATQDGINEIVTRDGSKTRVMLPDGTHVWLNGGSRLTYPNDFREAAIREVTLCGEAYFEVVHDESHPFVIHTKSIDVKDLGTAFNVKAYRDDETVEATLIEGSIEVVFRDDPSRKILLKPHEKITLFKVAQEADSLLAKAPLKAAAEKPAFQVIPVKPDPEYKVFAETAWTSNKLIFQDQPFDELAHEMEHRYGVRIQITDEKIKDYRLTGAFLNEPVQQALEELRLIAPFRYRITGDSIVIYP